MGATACIVCAKESEILPPWHPCEIKEAQDIEHWCYCLGFTEVVNNCQTVEADEGPSQRWGEFDPAYLNDSAS